MSAPILECKELHMHFGGLRAVDGLSCTISEGEIVGLIGPNGAGKTTLFNVISGFLRADSGKLDFKGKSILGVPPYKVAGKGIARTFQDLRLIKEETALENVLLFFRGQPGEKLVQWFMRRKKSKQIEVSNREEASTILKEAGIGGEAGKNAEDLSYGQQKLLSLACCFAAKADLLLLDEPVAGVDPDNKRKVLELLERLRDARKTIIVIEHDMDALAKSCDRLIFMDAGVKVAEGTPQEVLSDPRVLEAYIS